MKLRYVLIALALIATVGVLPGEAYSAESSPTMKMAMRAEGKGKNPISVVWGPGCTTVTVESADSPIHSVAFSFLDGTRDFANRYANDPLGYQLEFEYDVPIKSIQVKIHTDRYDGPGLGPVFKCDAELNDGDGACDGDDPPPWCYF